LLFIRLMLLVWQLLNRLLLLRLVRVVHNLLILFLNGLGQVSFTWLFL
jgi:hypothetical protein